MWAEWTFKIAWALGSHLGGRHSWPNHQLNQGALVSRSAVRFPQQAAVNNGTSDLLKLDPRFPRNSTLPVARTVLYCPQDTGEHV